MRMLFPSENGWIDGYIVFHAYGRQLYMMSLKLFKHGTQSDFNSYPILSKENDYLFFWANS